MSGPVPILPCGPNGPLGFLDFPVVTRRFLYGEEQFVAFGEEENLAVVGYGFTPSSKVDVTAIGTVPRELVTLVVFDFGLSYIEEASDTRFAEVVDSCPYKVSYDIRVVVDA